MTDQSYADRVVELYRTLMHVWAEYWGDLDQAEVDARADLSAALIGEMDALFPELADRFAKVREGKE